MTNLSDFQDALIALLDWVENKILSSDIYDDIDTVAQSGSSGSDGSEGVRLATELLKVCRFYLIFLEKEFNKQVLV